MRYARKTLQSFAKERARGLTLVEMLVVIGICGVLGLLLVPILIRSRSNARRVVCAGNLNELGQAYAVCLVESNNYLPEAYYTFERQEGDVVQVTFVGEEGGSAAGLLPNEYDGSLVCPSDDSPTDVQVRGGTGSALSVGSSYAYNVGLPLGFRNASRVSRPTDTVTFYDGDPAGVVGDWEHSLGWAANTVRNRHGDRANYLFLDGHVENSGGFPDRAFDGGQSWFALFDGGSGDGSDDEWEGEPSDPTIDWTIDDGTVTPNEACTVTITCLGAAFQNGEGGPRIPVHAYYRLDGGSRQELTDDVRGGERVVLEDFEPGTPISLVGKCTQYIRCTYESDDGSGHCWLMCDGDVVPSIAGFAGQAAIESFLEPYMTDDGHLTLGPNDVIFLFELSNYIDYNRYSCADFQDLVVLVTMSDGPAGGSEPDEPEGSDIGGSININPNNNSDFEFEMILPDGYTITRDDLHSDNPHHHAGSGFHPDYLEYTGSAVSVRVKPKGNGNQNGLTVDGEPYSLQNRNRYLITSQDMTVHLYNAKRNKKGKAMGKWWITIDAEDAEIQVLD